MVRGLFGEIAILKLVGDRLKAVGESRGVVY
jgi:hypothetical protein